MKASIVRANIELPAFWMKDVEYTDTTPLRQMLKNGTPANGSETVVVFRSLANRVLEERFLWRLMSQIPLKPLCGGDSVS